MVDPEGFHITPFTQVVHGYTGYQSLTDIPKALVFHEPDENFDHYVHKSTHELVEAYKGTAPDSYYGRAQLLGFLLEREGYDLYIGMESLKEHLVKINRQAGTLRLWKAVRYASSLLKQLVDSISPNITTLLVNGKQVRLLKRVKTL